jgi:hypothetical protein
MHAPVVDAHMSERITILAQRLTSRVAWNTIQAITAVLV